MIRKWLFRVLIIMVPLFILASIWFYFSLPDVSELLKNNPGITALIEQRKAEAAEEGRKIQIRKSWVSFSRIPEMLKKCVRISEDANFYFHEGIDFDELEESLKRNWDEGKIVRGASTITQQLAKNLYLSTDRSILRKLREFFIARRLENALSKNRIFSLYLNVIEFGPGIFGVEAASHYYFGKSVTDLSLSEQIRLTAVIPKPLSVAPTSNSRWMMWRCCWISRKLKLYKYIDEPTYESLVAEFC
jgi:monofunctional biosynthetic peptidoglycan transglycosylase